MLKPPQLASEKFDDHPEFSSKIGKCVITFLVLSIEVN